MKNDLVMGWVSIAMALLMVFCIVVSCINANWFALPVCGFAFGLNLMNAINHFRDYKMRKKHNEFWTKLNEEIQTYWPDDNNELEDIDGTLSSGNFIDD